MPLTVEAVLRNLSNTVVPHTISGDSERMIFSVERFRYDAENKDTLYVAPDGTKLPEDVSRCIITVPEEKIDLCISKVQEYITRDYRRNVELIKLQRAVLNDAEDDEIVSICCAIMGKSFLITTSQLRPIAISNLNEPQSHVSYSLIKNYINELSGDVELLPPSRSCADTRIVGKIVGQNRRLLGFIIFLNSDASPCDGADLEFTKQICSILSEWKRLQNALVFQDANADFINNILQKRITDPLIISQQMKALKWPASEKYYVLVVERTPTEQISSLRSKISYILHQEIYTYDRYYLAIINCSLKQRLDVSDFRNLIPLLHTHQMRATLSNSFTDFASLPSAFSQAVECLQFRNLSMHSLPVFCRYEDHLISHLICIAAKHGVDLLTMCDTVLLSILNQDRERGTENFKTIATYIFNGLNLKETAAALYVHRNTAYRRLQALEEQYQFRFENSAELERLKVTIIILVYLGMVNLEGCIQNPDTAIPPEEKG